MKKVVLLGGTGAMGTYLGGILANAGYDVVVTSRGAHQDGDGIRYAQGDGRNDAFLDSLLSRERPDAVVDFMSYSTAEFSGRMKRLLEGTSHYLYLSSYRVFAGEHPLTERSPRLLDTVDDVKYLQTDEYALTKARQENALRESGLKNWTILRPAITYSKNRFQFGCLEANVVCFRALRGLPVIMPGEMLEQRATLTWGRDVAEMIGRLVLNEKALGEDFNVTTSESHTWREIADVYSRHIGMKVQEVGLEEYCRLCNPYQVKYDRMFCRVLDNSKVLAATGMSQTDIASLERGLGGELDAFKSRPRFSLDYALNARIDRLCGIRMSLKGASWRDRARYFRGYYPWVNSMVRTVRKFV